MVRRTPQPPLSVRDSKVPVKECRRRGRAPLTTRGPGPSSWAFHTLTSKDGTPPGTPTQLPSSLRERSENTIVCGRVRGGHVPSWHGSSGSVCRGGPDPPVLRAHSGPCRGRYTVPVHWSYDETSPGGRGQPRPTPESLRTGDTLASGDTNLVGVGEAHLFGTG